MDERCRVPTISRWCKRVAVVENSETHTNAHIWHFFFYFRNVAECIQAIWSPIASLLGNWPVRHPTAVWLNHLFWNSLNTYLHWISNVDEWWVPHLLQYCDIFLNNITYNDAQPVVYQLMNTLMFCWNQGHVSFSSLLHVPFLRPELNEIKYCH